MEKVLVMGGSYFIGKHVVETLKDAYQVTVLNRGNQPLNDPLITELVADRNDSVAITSLLREKLFDHVIDISAYTSDQLDILVKALDMTYLKTYLFISSGAVYDPSNPLPIKENMALGGNSPYAQYAKDKIACENYLESMVPHEKLFIIRPPFVYGEDNYLLRERLIFHLIENNDPVFIPKSNNHIQFIYVKDLAKIISSMIKRTYRANTYNVGMNESIHFDAFVKACAKAMNKEVTIKWVDLDNVPTTHYFPFYPMNYVLDVSNLNNQLVVQTELLEGLKAAYHDYLKIKPINLPKRTIDAIKKLKSSL
ncbi:MAG: NAD-dependent epimerase/dehydratase family protein [Candidatus Izemoplasmataceae bacterium]